MGGGMSEITHLLSRLPVMASGISAAASGALVSAVWEGTVLAASVALCLHFVKGISAGIRSLLWTGVLLLIVLLHFVPLLNPMPGHSATQGKTLHLGLIWSVAIAGLWVVFSLIRVAQLMHSIFALRRIGRRSKPVLVSAEWASLLRANLRSAQLCTTVGSAKVWQNAQDCVQSKQLCQISTGQCCTPTNGIANSNENCL